ncbi:hypothetical protein GCM10011375_11660 [Hymenobacter qilianensis]|uniref:Uncharacterized protein n=1 Tax=Hymenobacter qilianensis TaxID=1385715 RepID=A0ACB5PP67_9BACT|nr:hypothetical protein GCM10011375_11660 [Hymenobacter qilianensis]
MSEISGLFKYFFEPVESVEAVVVESAEVVSDSLVEVLLWQALPTASGSRKASVRHDGSKNWGAFFIDDGLAGMEVSSDEDAYGCNTEAV